MGAPDDRTVPAAGAITPGTQAGASPSGRTPFRRGKILIADNCTQLAAVLNSVTLSGLVRTYTAFTVIINGYVLSRSG
ncbi:hypothetical protein NITHO_2490005 [Nitrolancea hollandica Lb]|uniref:Uncharacterized protein n=1 Tax=Nitrolancea hollandica Lb TaxID=1129897 RepID=I4EFX0_9BACT|nr:hypothetical protein NITHO_2490005 [Nitrolancea hollandica Lb]